MRNGGRTLAALALLIAVGMLVGGATSLAALLTLVQAFG